MKPILFNTEMVRAILDGRKTQTRRIIKSKYFDSNSIEFIGKNSIQGNILKYKFLDSIIKEFEHSFIFSNSKIKECDILYVRETWQKMWLDLTNSEIMYKASPETYGHWNPETIIFKPSIHMPKQYARIFLRVGNIRVERLQDISIEDILKEGISHMQHYQEGDVCKGSTQLKREWQELWNSTTKDGYKWEDNPYVFVYEFHRINLEDDL